MAGRYQVRIKDQSGAVQAYVTDFRSVRYSKRINGVGDIALELNLDHPAASLFELDGQIEVWRSDPENGVDWYLDFEGLHRTEVRQMFVNGRETITAYGSAYMEFLTRRLIAYSAGSTFTEKSGPIETVMKEFVDENIGPSANSASRDANGVMTGMSVEADLARGITWDGNRSRVQLYQVLRTLSEEDDVFFDVVSTGTVAWEFRFFDNVRSTDRTNTGLVVSTGLNAAGNAPVIFSVPRGNILSLAHTINRTDEVNRVIVLGQGLEEDRIVSVREDADLIAGSPWNLRELGRSAANETTQAALERVGDALLASRGKQVTFNFNPEFIPGLVYGKDYFWGDKVTARYRDEDFDVNIATVNMNIRQGLETITFDLRTIT